MRMAGSGRVCRPASVRAFTASSHRHTFLSTLPYLCQCEICPEWRGRIFVIVIVLCLDVNI